MLSFEHPALGNGKSNTKFLGGDAWGNLETQSWRENNVSWTYYRQCTRNMRLGAVPYTN